MTWLNEDTRRWFVLAAMGGVLGLIVLDETVVAVALPTIRADLDMSPVASHWVVNAYLLVFTSLALMGGKLCEILDMRNLLVGAILLFGLASLACGFAQNTTWLLSARALQGFAAAIIFPASIAIITMIFPPHQQGLAFGIHTSIGGLFMSLGPLVGGLFTEFLTWRWIFWINLPILLLITSDIWLAWKGPLRRKSTDKTALPALDWAGFALIVLALACLIVGLMQAPEWGWLSLPCLALFVLSAASLAAFIARERKVAAPFINLGLFKERTFGTAGLVIFSGQFGKIASIVFAAQFLQEVLKASPLVAGIALLAALAPSLITSTLLGRLSDRYGARKPCLAGTLLHGLALLALAMAAQFESMVLFCACLVIWGGSLPTLYVPTRRAALNNIPAAEKGQASGISMVAQLAGGTLGMAVCGSLLAATGNYPLLFLTAASVVLFALANAWRGFDRD